MSLPGIPQAKRATIIAMYIAGSIAAEIVAIASADGQPVTWQQIKSMMAWKKIKRPVVNDMVSFPRVWSLERDAIIARKYPGGMSVDAVIELLNAQPGRKITFDAFRQRLKVLQVGRANRICTAVARAIGISHRDAVAALQWAARHGVATDGPPLVVAARIAAAVQVAA